jgi:tRNA A-37 threonylcarbamoyl transferase component Bud32
MDIKRNLHIIVMMGTTSSYKKKDVNINKVIEDIDNKATAKLMESYADGSVSIPQIIPIDSKKATISMDNKNLNNTIEKLKNIMAEGAAEFEKKSGRPMTYSEMRQAFG